MSKADPRENLAQKYEDVALRFLQSQSEQDLYQAALLGRELLKEGIGPAEAVQLHFNTINTISKQVEYCRHGDVAGSLRAVLLEMMMVFGEAHQEIQHLLDERKQKCSELEQTKSELEQSRDELTEKTTQLIQTEKMTALGELAAGVAHEINQPLNAIKLICDDIVRDVERDRIDLGQLAGSLRDVFGEVNRLSDIINHMTVFTRRTEGSRKVRIDARVPVEGVLKLLGQQLKIHDVEVTQALGDELYIDADPVRLEQVIMNLVTNARDAVKHNSPEKGMRIRIELYSQTLPNEEQQFVVYEIRDNGCGISDEVKQKIFEPFFTQKPPGQGTGLGLSVTQQIVSDHGGRIDMQSRQGEGTAFKVLIPASLERK